MNFITYCRVSTDKQGVHGLGMDAQRDACENHCRRVGGDIIAAYIEAESGKAHMNRPQLLAALKHCKLTGSTLLIAKLDRLARNVAFISSLMESGVEFVAADMPTANRLTIHILAAVAEHERAAISTRVKDALGAIKREIATNGYRITKGGKRITSLGGFKARASVTPAQRELSLQARQERARIRAANLVPMIAVIRASGIVTLRGIASALDAAAVKAPRGGKWTATQVKRIEDIG